MHGSTDIRYTHTECQQVTHKQARTGFSGGSDAESSREKGLDLDPWDGRTADTGEDERRKVAKKSFQVT